MPADETFLAAGKKPLIIEEKPDPGSNSPAAMLENIRANTELIKSLIRDTSIVKPTQAGWKPGERVLEIIKLTVSAALTASVAIATMKLTGHQHEIAKYDLLGKLYPSLLATNHTFNTSSRGEAAKSTPGKNGNEAHIPVTDTMSYLEPLLATELVDVVTKDDPSLKSIREQLIFTGQESLLRILRDQVKADMLPPEEYFRSAALLREIRVLNGRNAVHLPLPVDALEWEAIDGTNLAEDLGNIRCSQVGGQSLELGERVSRTGVSPIGNALAQSLRAYARADLAFINSGSIRYHPGHDVVKGKIRTLDLYEIVPFRDYLVILAVRGDILEKALMHSVALVNDDSAFPHGSKKITNEEATHLPGRFPQVAGIHCHVVGGQGKGTVGRVENIMVQQLEPSQNGNGDRWSGYEKLSANKEYIVATSEYIAHGGDGFEMLAALAGSREGVRVLLGVASDGRYFNPELTPQQQVRAVDSESTNSVQIEQPRQWFPRKDRETPILLVKALYRDIAEKRIFEPDEPNPEQMITISWTN